MEYAYAVLVLNETGKEINETNITGVLEAAGVEVEESRVKALVAALEDVTIADVLPSTNVGEIESGEQRPSGESDAGDVEAAESDGVTVEEGGGQTETEMDSSQSGTVGGG